MMKPPAFTPTIARSIWTTPFGAMDLDLYRTPEFQALLRFMIEHRHELKESLSEDQKKLLERYDRDPMAADSITDTLVFTYAFKLGIHTALEAFDPIEDAGDTGK